MKAAITKKMVASGNDIRSGVRDKRVSYSGVSGEGNTVLVRFRDRAARHKDLVELGGRIADLELKTVDEASESRMIATLKPEAQRRTMDFALQQNITTLRNRVNELGVAEPIIQQQGAERIVVQLPGVQDTAKAKDILGRTATLEVSMVDDRARSNA